MTLPLIPPKTEPLVDKKDSFATLNWLVFFDQLADGDTGTTWTPTFVGLTEVGTATKTGVYYRISKKLVYYRIVITPATSTTAVNGTTYCDNFPLTMTANSANITCSGFTAAVSGTTSSDKRIYTSSWTAITTAITIVGIAEVQ
jgi:hypothetical protein